MFKNRMGCYSRVPARDIPSTWLTSRVTWDVKQLDDAFPQQASVHLLGTYDAVLGNWDNGETSKTPALTGLNNLPERTDNKRTMW